MGFFSGARYFSSHDGKRPEKSESETLFFNNNNNNNNNKTHRNARKKGAVRTSANIVAQLAVTSEKGVVNPVRSGSGSCNEISQKHQNRPNFIKLTCSARASRENKSLLWRQSRHIRVPSGLFRRILFKYFFFRFYASLCVFLKNKFKIRFSPIFFHYKTKSTSDRWSTYPFKSIGQNKDMIKENLVRSQT